MHKWHFGNILFKVNWQVIGNGIQFRIQEWADSSGKNIWMNKCLCETIYLQQLKTHNSKVEKLAISSILLEVSRHGGLTWFLKEVINVK